MCGIFGAINEQSVTGSLMAGLESLSYRGYDSAGIAVVSRQGLECRRAEGKLESLVKVLRKAPLEGVIGIAHTRWATHGAPTKSNAHPHMTSRVAVVHNGIIENYQELRNQLEADGYQFKSDTDSETIPLLITRNLNDGLDCQQAILKALSCLDGSFAIAAVFNDQPQTMYAARRGSPLVVGIAKDGFYISSDANAFGEQSSSICHLDDGDLAVITHKTLNITDINGEAIVRKIQPFTSNNESCDKAGFRHYMQKEIHQQPAVIKETFSHYMNFDDNTIQLPELPFDFKSLKRLSVIACGTSNYAGMIGKYWLEGFSGVSVDLDIASEYRYRNAPLNIEDSALFISQSGETADTLAALRHAKKASQNCLSIINVLDSTIARESDSVLPTLAGTEIGVASTKAFTGQLAVFLMLTLTAARENNLLDAKEEKRILKQLQKLPDVMYEFLQDEQPIRQVAAKLQHVTNMLYLGRGIAFPLALEGALKLKETSYIHAEAYPAGELKHGPIALVDGEMPIIVIAPPGPLFSKSLSNLREVSSRGGKVILISDKAGVEEAQDFIEDSIVMPDVEELLMPILYSLPLQLLAYHIAVLKGTDVDQPRNLAKSVTVE